MRFIYAALLLSQIFVVQESCAKKIQIIHTNDLHSYYFGYPERKAGGYARIKTLISNLKKEAQSQGIPSLVLDAGDFGEGAHYFLHNSGLASFKALEMMGVDAAVIGNHDYMFGGKTLSDQIQATNSTTQFLGANISHSASMRLKGVLKPKAVFNLDGLRVEVIGLATNSLHYMHMIRPGFIFPPAPVSRAYSKIAREDGAGLIVALTHIGLMEDKKLAQADPEIDVIVGGHSHSRLESAVVMQNSENREIPIVQTGAHAQAVGSLILEIKAPKEIEVVSYTLHDASEKIKADEEMSSFVAEADRSAKLSLGEGRWDEVIGYSQVDLAGYTDGRHDYFDGCWLRHLPEILQEGAQADIGLYLGVFTGKAIPKGPLTYGNIIENFPHANSFGERGWEIMKFELSGWRLYGLLLSLVNIEVNGEAALIGGVRYRMFTFPKSFPFIGGRSVFTTLKIDGKNIDFAKKYSIALPYELAKMLDNMLPKRARKYLPNDFERNGWHLWDLASDYIKKRKTIACASSSSI